MALVTSSLAELRAAERFAAKLAATVRATGSVPVSVQIDQLSCRGFSTLALPGVSIEDGITVHLPNLDARTAHIVHVLSGRMGCQFAEPLSDLELNAAFDDSTRRATPAMLHSLEDFTFSEPVLVPFPRRVRGFLAIGMALASWSSVYAILRLIQA